MKTFIIAAAALAANFSAALFSTALADEAADASAANVELAQDYIAAYSTFKTKNMKPFLADDMVFMDETSPQTILFEGKKAVMDGLGEYSKLYKDFSLDYDIARRFESNGVVVFIGHVTYAGAGQDGQAFSGTAPIVTAITIKDGKVVKHADYFDYGSNAVDLDE
ncbi:MAG: hypothetical protein DHS20C05_16260 [Hyphococcus sp.]|nr:MAG: hypothetical protein DHS20C05_16260 [Marinicaulis sp.]